MKKLFKTLGWALLILIFVATALLGFHTIATLQQDNMNYKEQLEAMDKRDDKITILSISSVVFEGGTIPKCYVIFVEYDRPELQMEEFYLEENKSPIGVVWYKLKEGK